MSEAAKWSTTGANILESDRLDAVRNHLENVGFVAVLWWHYHGAQAPTRLTFDDFADYEQFVKTQPVPGDAIDVWPFPNDPKQRIAGGKIPNEHGEVPERGAY